MVSRVIEAVTVFGDPLARIFADEDHTEKEAREIIVGYSAARHLLLVRFTERTNGRVRIFSARRVTKPEQQDYEESSN